MEEIYRAVAAKPVETNIDEASSYIRTGDINKPEVYSKICMNIGRTIDSAIGMNAVPSSVHLPQLLLIAKEVCRCKTEFLRPSLISLMLPIKAACQVGWFNDEDKDNLLMMVKEASYGLSNIDNMNIEPSYADSYISNIISRFYPRMKVERLLTSFDVKAGNGKFVVDFHISLGTLPPQSQNLWLLVARTDNMDTAACIASPANVDFLINRRGVPKRTKNDMGKGPQLPSNVTKMMKYGLNLLEVSGDFDGQYMIAVVFMNVSSDPDPPQLQDYIPPASVEVDSDCEVIEILSRISLNCPISQCRIKTPVKGHFCKHPQCFDYNFFMEVNSARPIWKCPVCNKPVCNLDIRIDQDFLKILNEAANNISHVIISDDGSWMVDMTERFQRPETNRDTKSQNNQVPSISIKTENIHPNSSPALCDSGCLANSSTAERPSTSRQSPVRTSVVSPQYVRDSCMQSQGLCDVVHTSPSVQQTSHQPNPVNTTQPSHSFTNPDHSSAQSQPQQGQTHQATPADLSTGNSTNSLTAERPSTLRQSPVTMSAVTPQDFRDFCKQSQGLCDVVHTSPSVQQTSHQPNPVNTTQPSHSFANPDHSSAQSQPQQGQTHQATPANLSTGTSETNRDNKGQNNHVPETPDILYPIKAENIHPISASALHNSGNSTNSLTAERPTTLRQSPVTMSAVTPQDFRDFCKQSQGLCDVVHTSPSVQQTSHQPNPVNTTQPSHSFANPDHSSAQSQPQQGQTHQATPANLSTGNSTNSLTAERPSTLRQSPVTMSAVTPQDFRDSCMQSQGLCDVVHTSPSVQQTSHQPNPVNTTQPSHSFANPDHLSAQSQPQQGQTHQPTPADLSTGTANKAQRKTLFTPVKLTPCGTSSLHSTVLDVEQLRKKVKRQYTARGQSHPPQAPASDIRPSSSVRPPKQSVDAMPTSKMRGSLRGKTLEAARLELLSSRQPIRANEPCSIPRPPLSTALPTQPPTNSENL